MYTDIDADTRDFLLSDRRLDAFLGRMNGGRRKTVRLSDVWSAFAETYEDVPDGPQRRVWLLTVLERLRDVGAIVLPVPHGNRWDRTSEVRLPKVVTLVQTTSRGAGADWKSFPWHPRLQWVLERRQLSASDVEFLRSVHQGLVEGWFDEQEPFKYRSLQLTGDEKRLAALSKGSLFGPGKLSLEMLGCEAEMLPLAVARFSAAPAMLLFENAAPFMLARRVLQEVGGTQVGCVGYGGGKQVIKSVGYFSVIEPAVHEIRYVGDLDAEGIQLAADVRRKSSDVPVRPASLFHLAMFESAAVLGAPDGWPVREGHTRRLPSSAIDHLDIGIRDRAARLVETGRRIPEEVISHSLMRRLVQEL